MQKQKVSKERDRSREAVTLSRAKDLMRYGERAAKLAISKGKTIDDWEGYCPLMGSNNQEAWRVGWDKEFTK